ncbi:OsmC family protein [Staphylococcus borealis]|uniref:OsmC family protein n=1 Tax=Staphylococcus borealis TaxID=2742203 RepID=UPI000D1F646F|nr:OsmC family protein [Staphylococcus borealis]MCQ9278061.1 OsmC family protein [Staphylococcus borealis]MDY4021769.1 OsmC family protein [Staphylococcus borealis]PTK66812.1 peroxiredoxin [Staphylococcus borealis]RIO69575.1 OsmC family peroxiredoxin [Staphylococcus borealis]
MVKHDFKVQTQWRGGREEVGTVSGDVITEQISIPAPLGGNGTGTNPDELLVSAASSCYIISLAATLERAKFTNIQITNDSIGSALFENGKFKMATISHYPKILVTSSEKEKLENRLPKLLEVADNNCMISNAIRNNVEIQIQATIQ